MLTYRTPPPRRNAPAPRTPGWVRAGVAAWAGTLAMAAPASGAVSTSSSHGAPIPAMAAPRPVSVSDARPARPPSSPQATPQPQPAATDLRTAVQPPQGYAAPSDAASSIPIPVDHPWALGMLAVLLAVMAWVDHRQRQESP